MRSGVRRERRPEWTLPLKKVAGGPELRLRPHRALLPTTSDYSGRRYCRMDSDRCCLPDQNA